MAARAPFPPLAPVTVAFGAPLLLFRLHPWAPQALLALGSAILLVLAWPAASRHLSSRSRDAAVLLVAAALAGSLAGFDRIPRPLPVGIPRLSVRCRLDEDWGRIVARGVQVRDGEQWRALPGEFLVPGWDKGGGKFRGGAFLAAWEEPQMPGLADRGRAGRLSGLRGKLLIPRSEADSVDLRPSGWRARCRAALAGRLGRSLPASLRSIMPGFLWGERTDSDPDLERTFRGTGTLHLLAISGLHVTLIAFVLDFLMRILVRDPRTRLLLVLTGLAAYGGLVGPMPSVVRSIVMGAMLLSARACGRPGAVSSAWWASLLVTVIATPEECLRPGMQLSFAGTAALILAPPSPRLLRPIWMSAIAIAATSGILWAHFGETSPMAVVANITGVPGFAPVLLAVLWGMACGDPGEPLLQSIAWGPARVLAEAWIAPLRLLAPLGERCVLRLSPGEGTGLVMTLSVLILLWIARLGADRRTVVAGWLVLLVLLGAGHVGRGCGGGKGEVVILPVGQGDGILIRAGTRACLVDTGPGGRDGTNGRRALAPALRSLGITALESVVLTHGDEDHCGGLRGLLVAGIRVDTLRVSARAEYRLRLPRRSVPAVARLTAGDRFGVPGGVADVLHPFADTPGASGNGGSIAARVRLDGFDLVLPGDLAREGEEDVLARRPPGPCDALVAGHHGSAHSTGDTWLEELKPRLAIVSCGPRNRFGHPSARTLERLAGRGIPVVRTDRDGTIRIRSGPSGWTARCARPSDFHLDRRSNRE